MEQGIDIFVIGGNGWAINIRHNHKTPNSINTDVKVSMDNVLCPGSNLILSAWITQEVTSPQYDLQTGIFWTKWVVCALLNAPLHLPISTWNKVRTNISLQSEICVWNCDPYSRNTGFHINNICPVSKILLMIKCTCRLCMDFLPFQWMNFNESAEFDKKLLCAWNVLKKYLTLHWFKYLLLFNWPIL